MANECLDLITKANKGILTDDELDALITDLQATKEEAMLNLGIDSVEGAMFKRAVAIADDERLKALAKKRMVLKEILIEEEIMAMTDEANAIVGNPIEGLKERLGGGNVPVYGAMDSTGSRMEAIQGQFLGGLFNDLEASGLLRKFTKMGGDFQLEVRRALFDLGTPGAKVRGAADAIGIAKIMKKYNDAIMNRKNLAGAFIRPLKGFTGNVTHNARLIRKAGKKKWVADALDSYDAKAMKIPAKRIASVLDDMYDDLSRGHKPIEDVRPDGFEVRNGADISKKISQHRVIIYKSADAADKMDNLYGNGGLKEQFISGIRNSARSIALLDKMGSDPYRMVNTIRKRLQEKYAGDHGKLDAIESKTDRLATVEGLLPEVTGDINRGSDEFYATMFSNIRAWKTMTALGSVIYSVVGDPLFFMGNRIFQGASFGRALGDMATNIPKGLKMSELSNRFAIGFNGMMGDIGRGFGATDVLNGRMSKAMSLFFKLNFLTWWTDANQRGATYVIANDLGIAAKKSFDAIDEDLRRILHIYGIDAKKWEVARQAIETMPDGNVYLMPDLIKDVSGGVFRGMSKAQQVRFKTDIQDSIYTLLTNEATISIPEPGTRERAIMRRGYRPNTVAGEALRFIWQFKGFGVSVLSRVMGRQLYGTGAKSVKEAMARGLGANLGFATIIVGATFGGLISYQLKQIKAGKDPREFSGKLLMAGFVQGGGLGIYADFLFAEYNRFGGGPLQTLAGPVIGDAAELVKIFQKLQSDNPDVRGEALRLVKRNIPFANLLYVKDAMDYLIWYQLQEALNPGYLRRNEQRVKRQNNQGYWLPPSSIVATGGGFK